MAGNTPASWQTMRTTRGGSPGGGVLSLTGDLAKRARMRLKMSRQRKLTRRRPSVAGGVDGGEEI